MKTVWTNQLTKGDHVKDRNRRVLIIDEVEEISKPYRGSSKVMYQVIGTDKETGNTVKHTAAALTAWKRI